MSLNGLFIEFQKTVRQRTFIKFLIVLGQDTYSNLTYAKTNLVFGHMRQKFKIVIRSNGKTLFFHSMMIPRMPFDE